MNAKKFREPQSNSHPTKKRVLQKSLSTGSLEMLLINQSLPDHGSELLMLVSLNAT